MQVLAGEGAAEFAGDEERVAVHGPGAEDAFVAGDFAEEGDGNQEAFGVGGCFAADYGDTVTVCEFGHAVVDFLDEFGVEVVRQGECDEGGEGAAGHGGNVAEAAGEGLVTNAFGGRGGEEMDAFDHGVGFEEEGAAGLAGIQDGAIVTRTDNHAGVGRKRRTETGDEVEFVHLTVKGLLEAAVRSARIKLAELSRQWAVMEAQRLAGPFIEENQHQREDCQRNERERVDVHCGKQERGNPEGGAGKAVLFDGGIDDAAKEYFLRDRSDENRDDTHKDHLAPGQSDILQGLDERLLCLRDAARPVG